MFEQSFAGWCQSDYAVATHKQFCTDLLFQSPDGGGERWLGHIETFSRAMEMELLSHDNELAQFSKINHSFYPCFSTGFRQFSFNIKAIGE
jgi:hypothetical protein